jgi:putative transposase
LALEIETSSKKSGYYAWRSRPASARATADADLTRRIRMIHAGSHGTYGAPRIHAELQAEGVHIARKRVARLMRAAGIASVSRRRRAPVTTRQAPDHRPASDLVRRNFVTGNRCKEAGVRPSTGSVGDAYDNAMCESFFATLECELIDRHRFRSHTEARMAVFQFIEGFYNPSRRHSALGYLSPIEYERRREGLIKPP